MWNSPVSNSILTGKPAELSIVDGGIRWEGVFCMLMLPVTSLSDRAIIYSPTQRGQATVLKSSTNSPIDERRDMKNNRTCVFLTMQNPEEFVVYDHLATQPLGEFGWSVVEIPWDQPAVDWAKFDVVVIRSTWDYQDRPEQFLKVLSEIETNGTPLLNPLSICEWNINKTYLRELESKGIRIVPTEWPDQLNADMLKDYFADFACEKLVAKPTIGANADDTYVLEQTSPETWTDALRVFANRPSMVQPFLDSIIAEGEFSLFYFGDHYSHAILKTPQSGDFRVQEEHGGTIQAVTVSPDVTKLAQQVIAAIPEELLYSRVDVVRLENGDPALIELELIEPSLYFSYDDQSPVQFAKQLNMMAQTLC